MSNTIFNVTEAQGADRVQFETTAAAAQLDAPTAPLAREVEENADHAKEVAHHAASVAQTHGTSLTGQPPSAVNQLQEDARQTTNAAVAEGQRDVEAAKVTGAGYVDQAKSLASSALATAQSYLPANASSQTPPATSEATTTSYVAQTIQAGATTALGTAKEYLASAHETGMAAAQPHLERVKGVAQGYLGSGTQGTGPPPSSNGIPATSAPLESGPHSVDTPYPSTATKIGSGQKIAENDNKTSTL